MTLKSSGIWNLEYLDKSLLFLMSATEFYWGEKFCLWFEQLRSKLITTIPHSYLNILEVLTFHHNTKSEREEYEYEVRLVFDQTMILPFGLVQKRSCLKYVHESMKTIINTVYETVYYIVLIYVVQSY